MVADGAAWIRGIKHNPDFPISPLHYDECFRAALRRLSLAINWNMPRFRSCVRWLLHDDNEIAERFRKRRLDPLLFTFGHLTMDPGKPEEEEAQDYFYGLFEVRVKDEGTPTERTMVDQRVTQKFFKDSYAGLFPPKYDPSILGIEEFYSPQAFYEACATNYLLKNAWHTYVHCRVHGINFSNYRQFAGPARQDSDFEADNLSNILLVKSYGLPLDTQGWDTENKEIIALLRRNRCNEVFATRARQRHEKPRFLEDKEYRYCRTLANYVSGWLLAAGRAAASLGVFLAGDLARRRHGERIRVKPEIVVEVDRIRIATQLKGLAEEYAARSLPEEDLKRHRREVAQAVDLEYKRRLRKDSNVRTYAKNALKTRLKLIGVES